MGDDREHEIARREHDRVAIEGRLDGVEVVAVEGAGQWLETRDDSRVAGSLRPKAVHERFPLRRELWGPVESKYIGSSASTTCSSVPMCTLGPAQHVDELTAGVLMRAKLVGRRWLKVRDAYIDQFGPATRH